MYWDHLCVNSNMHIFVGSSHTGAAERAEMELVSSALAALRGDCDAVGSQSKRCLVPLCQINRRVIHDIPTPLKAQLRIHNLERAVRDDC